MKMNLESLIKLGMDLADDMLPQNEVKEFVNDAIAAINIEVKADFPFLVELDEEPVFPEKWQRMLIVPYVKGRIKEKDSSQFEWESGYEQFFTNLHEFSTSYEIPEEYQSEENSVQGNMLNNVPYIWGGW